MPDPAVRLRPLTQEDVAMMRRFVVEPGLIGLDWRGFSDPEAPARRFAEDGYVGPQDGRLIVEVTGEAAGFVSYRAGSVSDVPQHWTIGIALLPEWRGRGVGWRAQSLLCEYLFTHSPAWKIEAGTHPENIAEQRALEKVGFTREATVRAAEFRDGQWRDGVLYGLLRTDPLRSSHE
ncbi:alanine acetyltransferase [Virgisporangium aliadipatigenens]|uniref:Alanine acetyltransferase n=1 Tax=Virgisporangium aliadipatigenens TaxID=741659 RepID=A0A8J4DNC9_9ACTN|nr:GNAT family protein [Virgisporangium aliadipatigenens]GIJ44274.1 alanine acetyltransferase [Virgisporangium aliadipatigenens]